MKTGLARALLVLAASITGLVIVEVAARLGTDPPRYHSRLLEYDGELGYRGIPGARYERSSPIDPSESHRVELNADGFRGRVLPTDPPPEGVHRVALIGDSILVGEAVAEDALISNQLEAALERSDLPTEVFNLSAIDYGTGQQLLLLRQLAPALRPQALVLFLFPSNDVANNGLDLAGRTRISPGDPLRPYVTVVDGRVEIDWADPMRARARRLSRVFGLLERGFFPPVLDRRVDPDAASRVRRGAPPRAFLDVFVEHDPGHRWSRAWRDTEDLLRAFRQNANALGARLLVVVVPSRHQVETTPQRLRFEAEARLANGSLTQLLDWNHPERRLLSFFAAEGIESLVLLSSFREATERGEQLYARDHHLSPQGHARIAERLAGWLETETPTIAAGGPLLRAAPIAWPTERDPLWLDFRNAPHADQVGDGFFDWRPVSAEPGGWPLAGEGLIAVRNDSGRLVVRGWATRAASLDLFVLGGQPVRIRIEAPGEFSTTLDPPANSILTRSRHALLGLRTPASDGAILVQQVWFEGARPEVSDAAVERRGEGLP